MADEANTATPKVKTVAEDMDNRRLFPNVDAAKEYLAASATNFDDFGDVPLAMPGLVKDDEGNVKVDDKGLPETDPAVYTDSMNVMVSLLKKQGEGVKAIVVAPVPQLPSLLDSDAGKQWVEKIINKELNHVAVRHLRDAEDVLNFVDQMPVTVEGYITSERGTGGIIESFNQLYKNIDATFSKKFANWSKRRFIKSELRKALESKAYAQEFYADIEDYKGRSLFVDALDVGVAAAKRMGIDPTIFERWKATRDQKAFTPGEEDEEDFDLESLTDALLTSDEEAAPAAPAGEEAPAGETVTEEAEATA